MNNTIALIANNGYLDKPETTIKSILVNNKNVDIYVINPDIPHEWFLNMNQYANQFGSKIVDSKLDPNRVLELHEPHKLRNNMTYARLFISDLIDADKVLYLDSDLVVDANLNDLFQIDFGDKMLYAVRDYQMPDQFNAGVLLINNKRWREENVRPQLIETAKDPSLPYKDQSTLNKFFEGKIGELDLAYNYQAGFERVALWNADAPVYKYLKEVKNPKIIHYISSDKPFNITSTVLLRDLWWHYYNYPWEDIVEKYTKFDKKKIGKLNFDANAFMFTKLAENQDLEKLVKKLPNIHFDIAAYTDMAFLLKKLTKYDNVTLHPSIVGDTLTKLIKKSNVYLDINYGPNEDGVVERIVKQNIPIYSFEETKTNNLLENDNYHLFKNGQVDEMANAINSEVEEKNRPSFDIHVKNIDESLDLILKDKKSVIRFGDGEFDLIRGNDIPYQTYNEDLALRLKSIILSGSYENTLICLPDVFKNLNRYGEYAQKFYHEQFFPENAEFLKSIEKTKNEYGSTFISRPYIDLVDKSRSGEYFHKLKQLWDGRDILIVEGKLTRSGVGNDLFSNANSVKRILAPSKDAFSKIEDIELSIIDNADNRLILLMLGPTAKVITDDLNYLNLENQIIDIGHIDSEYEWFKMGVKSKVKLNNKHTAEFNYDENIEPIHDEKYQSEIVDKIE